ncbi:MAG TPA: ABC transporter ATP-binding protein [Acidobacteriota bacterium]|nr:ABC transporter ATP-binding protein [Acidobacteriota bacterium]HQF85589.1 ABC transporter ATP-binding protein [Acidobacteriota bacterium]HQG91167.1 ABC transporter ATP-binding protein [Acidobacteriota bacterium]
MSDPAIAIDRLRYAYRPGRPVLRDLSLAVPAGAVMGFLGPNGAGKTTLMHLLNGFMPPDAGAVQVLGREPWRERVAVQRRLAFVPEYPPAYPWLTVTAFLAFYRRVCPGWDEAAARRRLDEAAIPMDQPCGGLSRGQQGLVSLGVALGRPADVLLLDDPTLGLDVLARRRLYTAVVEELAARAVTILFATHLPAEVEGVLTHAAFVAGGRIVAAGALEDLKAEAAAAGRSAALEDIALHHWGGDHAA